MQDRESALGGLGDVDSPAAVEPVTLPTGVSLDADISYGRFPAQRLDVYWSAGTTAAPVIFMVHGGAWSIGDKKYPGVVANKLHRWVPRGFIFVSVNYRLWPRADPLAQADDVARALAFAQSHAADWGGGASRFILMGHSSGAHLVALLAVDAAVAARQGVQPWLGTVALDSAAYDVPRIMERPHYPFYDRVFGDDPAYWREASPYHRFVALREPLLLVCSSERDDSCDQAEAFAARIQSAGGIAVLRKVAESHRDINRKLGLPGSYTDTVEEFIRSLGIGI